MPNQHLGSHDPSVAMPCRAGPIEPINVAFAIPTSSLSPCRPSQPIRLEEFSLIPYNISLAAFGKNVHAKKPRRTGSARC